MQVAAKVAREGGREKVGGDWVHIGLNLIMQDQIEISDRQSGESVFSGSYLEVGFPPEVFEVFCWFRDQLVEVSGQVLWAEMFLSLLIFCESEAAMHYWQEATKLFIILQIYWMEKRK